jgi:hypothetical protein
MQTSPSPHGAEGVPATGWQESPYWPGPLAMHANVVASFAQQV